MLLQQALGEFGGGVCARADGIPLEENTRVHQTPILTEIVNGTRISMAVVKQIDESALALQYLNRPLETALGQKSCLDPYSCHSPNAERLCIGAKHHLLSCCLRTGQAERSERSV